MRFIPRPGRVAIAVLLGSSVLAASPGRARAADAVSQTPEIACSALSVGVPVAAVIGALIWSDDHNHRAWEAVLYVGGAAGLALGGTAIGLQSTRPGSCGDDCLGVYFAGGGGMTAGAIAIFAGIMEARSPRPRPHPGGWNPSLMLLPTPLVLATERGPRLGLGLTGVSF
jgi:hypothetical protein